MVIFTFDGLVEDIRTAAKKPDRSQTVKAVLQRYVSNPASIIDATPNSDDDEIMLFEDENISIWWCRFQPHVTMPPHEHKLEVHIATYSGGEKNILFKREAGKLRHDKTHVVQTGEVFSLDEDGLHAVVGNGDQPSLSLHVYMGPLTTLKRDLFDWETGEAIDFTMENFADMKRPSSSLPPY
jgi:predicted metal-dependent enzyme (double-stranded beta helix superfamily)